MNQTITVEDIAEFGKGEYFLEVNNNVGQNWYFPYKNIRKYRSIFRPSSLAGKLAYQVMPFIKHLRYILPYLKMRRVRLKLKESITEKIKDSLQGQNFTFAIFCGSPGKHQKLTLMIRVKERIAGYCKISDNPQVVNIFRKEKDALIYLNNRNVRMLPKVLMLCKADDTSNIWMYMQSTEQEDNTTYPTINNKEIFDYILDIQEKCISTTKYRDTEYYNDMCRLKELYPLHLDSETGTILKRCIDEIEDELGKERALFTFAHGDFTPWNSFLTSKGVFAFDFEYCRMTYPFFYDVFHFYTQSCIYDRNMECKAIYKEYITLKRETLSKYIETDKCDFYYKCYLLGIIGFYLSRDNGILNKRLEECFKIWIGLINNITNG